VDYLELGIFCNIWEDLGRFLGIDLGRFLGIDLGRFLGIDLGIFGNIWKYFASDLVIYGNILHEIWE
jgi:hypothetical protein